MQLFTPLSDPLNFSSNTTNSVGIGSSSTTAPTTPTSMTGAIGGAVGSAVVSGIGGAIFSSRVIAILLGLLLIGGAVILFATDEIFDALKSGNVTGAVKATGRAALDAART